jgi:hypothetical protein
MHEIHFISIGINAINVIILAMLISVYLKNYRVLKSSHNKGLLIFSLLFLVENIIQIHLGIFNWPYQAVDIIMHIVIINVLQLLGLLTLLKVTWK